MMQIFSLTDSNTFNLMSSCSLASERVNEYWKFETIALKTQNKILLNSMRLLYCWSKIFQRKKKTK